MVVIRWFMKLSVTHSKLDLTPGLMVSTLQSWDICSFRCSANVWKPLSSNQHPALHPLWSAPLFGYDDLLFHLRPYRVKTTLAKSVWHQLQGRHLIVFLKTFLFPVRNPNPSHLWAESVLPQWPQVVSSDTPLTYLELSPTLKHNEGLSQRSCSFWNHLASRLTSTSSESHQSSRHVIRIKLQLRTMTSPH